MTSDGRTRIFLPPLFFALLLATVLPGAPPVFAQSTSPDTLSDTVSAKTLLLAFPRAEHKAGTWRLVAGGSLGSALAFWLASPREGAGPTTPPASKIGPRWVDSSAAWPAPPSA
jgi:hypothetical protein